MDDSIGKHKQRAKLAIESGWKNIAERYTFGWCGPLSQAVEKFPYIADNIVEIKTRVTKELPIAIFQTRENPPEKMIAVVPYRSLDGNPYNSRVLPSSKITNDEAKELVEFVQAFWFLVATKVLPSPFSGDDLENALLKITGSDLIAIYKN